MLDFWLPVYFASFAWFAKREAQKNPMISSFAASQASHPYGGLRGCEAAAPTGLGFGRNTKSLLWELNAIPHGARSIMGAKRTRRRGTSKKQRAYLESAGAMTQRLAALQTARRVFEAMPRCGALAKSTGKPCRKIALANGRCAIHGGLTPSGRGWHVAQASNATASIRKLERKLRDLARRRRQSQSRIDAMTEGERAEYQAWVDSHRAGSGSDRERTRRDRAARAWLEQLSSAPPDPLPPEQEALAALIAKLKAHVSALHGGDDTDETEES